MLQIILGNNITESREQFVKFKQDYKTQGYETIELNEENIFQLNKWLYQADFLFSLKKAFFGENLLSKKPHREILKKYDKKENVDFILWEKDLEEKSVKTSFKNARIYNHKLPYSIFKFLDGVYPGNLTAAFNYLKQISRNVEENIILFMLQRRIRDLVLIKNNLKPEKKLADWQIFRLRSQTTKWNSDRLIEFYDALYRIEAGIKTNTTHYSIQKSLDILFCYYLI